MKRGNLLCCLIAVFMGPLNAGVVCDDPEMNLAVDKQIENSMGGIQIAQFEAVARNPRPRVLRFPTHAHAMVDYVELLRSTFQIYKIAERPEDVTRHALRIGHQHNPYGRELIPLCSGTFTSAQTLTTALLGTYVAAKALLSEGGYNHEVPRAFGDYLSAYQAQDRATTKAAFKLVADEWYQEKSRIPDPWKTLKRHLNSYPEVTPWIHPKAKELGCNADAGPEVKLQVPEQMALPDGKLVRLTDLYELRQIAHKKIPVDFLLEKESAQKQLITHRDFPQVVKKIGELIRQAYADKGFASPDL